MKVATGPYYEVHGEGPTIIFAHGLGGNHASWFQQVPFFARFYKLITFDHRGFGNSRDATGGADRSRFVDDLRSLVDELGINKVALVAQSMGGGTCANFATRYPERTRFWCWPILLSVSSFQDRYNSGWTRCDVRLRIYPNSSGS